MLKKKKMFLNNQLEGVHGLGGEIFSIQPIMMGLKNPTQPNPS